ncbi:hypothetical protein Hanom_Chr01g00038151 [Helianthus anomalus]
MFLGVSWGIWKTQWERLGVSCNPSSTLTLPTILCGIQVKGKYEWRRFVLDGRRDFTDYSIGVPSDG